ncbi:class I SAM-dependent methyltransferase [Paludisphaera mucosa]|uniref:Class I SAM-dependent methyltransferase n=1 Tax=Paludisphaera mucosa TaxID=3030827 RepID=A0ABT6FIA9_9BACT|nr:class I SAM-dependent methyltransferase [Paludisphaera mucosa]MDG3007321.1 class I SAM-dependent methyltransferase [Paludisphaera mucosa]
MMDVIPFDPRRFKTAAASYLVGRPVYPPRLFRRIVELCGLDRSHRAMDLGCGPGQIAIALAPYVGRVVAVDPEPEMLKIAAGEAERAGREIEFVQASSYDLGPRFGTFRLVAMGRSFHWMDRAETLRRLDAMIEPEGAVAFLHDDHPTVPDNAWFATFQEIVARHAADDVAKRVRAGRAGHESVLLDSPFRRLERITVFERSSIPVDALVLRLRSMSSVARSRVGDRAEDLAAEVREAITPFARDGLLSEVIAASALIASREGP